MVNDRSGNPGAGTGDMDPRQWIGAVLPPPATPVPVPVTSTPSVTPSVTTSSPAPTTPNAPAQTLFITEVADPGDLFSARFVELYTGDSAGQTISTYQGYDLYLGTAYNSGTTFGNKKLLTGSTIGSDGFFVLCYDKAVFESTYQTTCDLEASNINSNGNDVYAVSVQCD